MLTFYLNQISAKKGIPRSLGFIFSSPEQTELMFFPEFGDKYSFLLGFERTSFCRLLLILYLYFISTLLQLMKHFRELLISNKILFKPRETKFKMAAVYTRLYPRCTVDYYYVLFIYAYGLQKDIFTCICCATDVAWPLNLKHNCLLRGFFEIIQIEMKLATYNEVIEFMQMQNPREYVKIACEIFLE